MKLPTHLHVEALEPRYLLAAVELLADINKTATGCFSGDDVENIAFAEMRGELYFTFDQAVNSDGCGKRHLWKTDGTANGTEYLDTVWAVYTGSHLTTVNDQLVFSGFTKPSRGGLVISDGQPGGIDFAGRQRRDVDLVVSNGERAFFFTEVGYLYEMWVTDGTKAGTQLLVEIRTPGSYPLDSLTFVGDRLFFQALDYEHGSELWTTDGTVEGTYVIDIRPGRAGSFPTELTNIDGTLYFSAFSGTVGTELMRSDGTFEGTQLVHEMNPGVRGGAPRDITSVGNQIFFLANNAETGRELWVSDGTDTNTRMVADIHPGVDGSQIADLTPFGDQLFFVANDGSSGNELWSTDGVRATLIKDIWPGTSSGVDQIVGVLGDQLFFVADDGAHGMELWSTNGLSDGTRMVLDIFEGAEGSNIVPLRTTPAHVFFQADDGAQRGVWRTDGTRGGTVKLLEIPRGVVGASYAAFGNFHFAVQRPDEPIEFWASDGTPEGTVSLGDFASGNAEPREVFVFGDDAYFLADHERRYDVSLWKTDGTTEGTSLVADLPGEFDDNVGFVGSGANLFFALSWNTLWRTDGTADGTFMIADHRGISQLTDVDGTLYYVAHDDVRGREIWRTDGTPAGSRIVTDLRPEEPWSGPSNLFAWNGRLYFTADTGTTGLQLWVTDGTPEGTQVVMDFAPGITWSEFTILSAHADSLYFCLESSDDGTSELWSLDVSSHEARLLHELPAPGLFLIGVVNETLIFSTDAIYALPYSNMTSPPLFIGRNTSDPIGAQRPNLTPSYHINGRLVFGDGDGNGLWITDGTAEGTELVSEPLNPSWNSAVAVNDLFYYEYMDEDGHAGLGEATLESLPTIEHRGMNLTVLGAVNNQVLFTKEHPLGRELWVFRPDSLFAKADFNGDSALDVHDLDALVLAIAAGGQDASLDLSGDGLTSALDRRQWLTLAGGHNLESGTAYQAGDANLDGRVDGIDFGLWNTHRFTVGSGWSSADFNADGFVDASDFGIWNDNKFLTTDLPVAARILSATLPTRVARGQWAAMRQKCGGVDTDVPGKISFELENGVTESQYRKIVSGNSKAKNWGWTTMRRNPGVYVRGRIRHPDHATITLHGWHQVVMNTEIESRAMRNVAFLD